MYVCMSEQVPGYHPPIHHVFISSCLYICTEHFLYSPGSLFPFLAPLRCSPMVNPRQKRNRQTRSVRQVASRRTKKKQLANRMGRVVITKYFRVAEGGQGVGK